MRINQIESEDESVLLHMYQENRRRRERKRERGMYHFFLPMNELVWIDKRKLILYHLEVVKGTDNEDKWEPIFYWLILVQVCWICFKEKNKIKQGKKQTIKIFNSFEVLIFVVSAWAKIGTLKLKFLNSKIYFAPLFFSVIT